MVDYLYYVVLMDTAILLCMIFMAKHNDLLLKRQQNGFIASYVLIIILSIMELISVIINNVYGYTWLNILTNTLVLGLSPYIPVLFGNSISKFKTLESKIAIGTLIIYDIILCVGLPFNWIFSVDSLNHYSRGVLFPLFLVVYISSKLYLVYSSAIMLKKFQHRNNLVVILLLISFLLGSTIQIFRPDVHTSFSCITIIGIVYYAFFNDLWQQIDRMTGLYSHQAYIARASRLKLGESIIIMDCDNFKQVNDKYGHEMGDECILAVSRSILSAYDNYGICYRIGGDEFAVILFKGADGDALKSKFIEYIRQERLKNPILPYVSSGIAICKDGANPREVKNMADKVMYADKKQRKNLNE